MNFRNRKFVTAMRIILGLFILMSGVSGLMLLASGDMKGIPEPMLATTQMLWQTGIFQMIKVTEVVVGLMLIFGFLPALAAIFLAPISVGIIVVNARTAPDYVITGVIVAAFNIFLGYAYWDKYKALFERK